MKKPNIFDLTVSKMVEKAREEIEEIRVFSEQTHSASAAVEDILTRLSEDLDSYDKMLRKFKKHPTDSEYDRAQLQLKREHAYKSVANIREKLKEVHSFAKLHNDLARKEGK